MMNGSLGHTMRSSCTQTRQKLMCLLGFLGNADTRDGQGEERIRNLQHSQGAQDLEVVCF